MTDPTETSRFVTRDIIARFERELGRSLPNRDLLEAIGEACFMRGATAGMERSQELLNEVLANGAK